MTKKLQNLQIVAIGVINKRRGFFGANNAIDELGKSGVLNQAMKNPQEGLENTDVIDRLKKRYSFDKLFSNRFGNKLLVRHPLGGYWKKNPKSMEDFTDDPDEALKIKASDVLGNSSLLKEAKTVKIDKQEINVYSGSPQTPRMTVYRDGDGTFTLDYAKSDPLNKREASSKDLDEEVRRLFGYESWNDYKKNNFKDLTKRVIKQKGKVTSAPTVHPFHVAYGLEEFFESFDTNDYEVLGLVPESIIASAGEGGGDRPYGLDTMGLIGLGMLGAQAIKSKLDKNKKKALKDKEKKDKEKKQTDKDKAKKKAATKKQNKQIIDKTTDKVKKDVVKKTGKKAAIGTASKLAMGGRILGRVFPITAIALTAYDVIDWLTDWFDDDEEEMPKLEKRAAELPDGFVFPDKESFKTWQKTGKLPETDVAAVTPTTPEATPEPEVVPTPEKDEGGEKFIFSTDKLKFFIVPKDWRSDRAFSWLTLDEATLAMRVGANIDSGISVGLNGKTALIKKAQEDPTFFPRFANVFAKFGQPGFGQSFKDAVTGGNVDGVPTGNLNRKDRSILAGSEIAGLPTAWVAGMVRNESQGNSLVRAFNGNKITRERLRSFGEEAAYPQLKARGLTKIQYNDHKKEPNSKFQQAFKLAPKTAIAVTAWGTYQVLGSNIKQFYVDNPQKFYDEWFTNDKGDPAKSQKASAKFLKVWVDRYDKTTNFRKKAQRAARTNKASDWYKTAALYFGAGKNFKPGTEGTGPDKESGKTWFTDTDGRYGVPGAKYWKSTMRYALKALRAQKRWGNRPKMVASSQVKGSGKVLVFGHSQAGSSGYGGAVRDALKTRGLKVNVVAHSGKNDNELSSLLAARNDLNTYTHAVLMIGGNIFDHLPRSQERMINLLIKSGLKKENIYVSTPPINTARLEKGVTSQEKDSKRRTRDKGTRSLARRLGVNVIQTIETDNPNEWRNSKKHGKGMDIHIRKSSAAAQAMARSLASNILSKTNVTESNIYDQMLSIINEVQDNELDKNKIQQKNSEEIRMASILV